MNNHYKKKWDDLLEKNFFPSFVKNIKIIDFKEFNKIVINMGKESDDLVNNIFDGDVLVIKNVFKKEDLIELKNNIYDKQNKEKEQNYKMIDGCPNFHISNKQNKLAPVRDNYDETAHSHYFFRWNNDSLKIFNYFENIWELIKLFSGLDKDDFKKSTPKDKIIDRIQVLRYPLNEGYITTHCDVSAWQKLNIGICLYENGKDFDSGGLYLLDKNENKINVENKLELGDCFCWIPTIFHGVEIPRLKGEEKIDWNSNKGRWQALALTVQSHCVQERILSTGYEKFKKNPLKYKKIYRNAYKKN